MRWRNKYNRDLEKLKQPPYSFYKFLFWPKLIKGTYYWLETVKVIRTYINGWTGFNNPEIIAYDEYTPLTPEEKFNRKIDKLIK